MSGLYCCTAGSTSSIPGGSSATTSTAGIHCPMLTLNVRDMQDGVFVLQCFDQTPHQTISSLWRRVDSDELVRPLRLHRDGRVVGSDRSHCCHFVSFIVLLTAGGEVQVFEAEARQRSDRSEASPARGAFHRNAGAGR